MRCALLAVCSCGALSLSLTPAARTQGARLALIGRREALLVPLLLPQVVSAATSNEGPLLDELAAVRTALEPLPALLDDEKWDSVRSVLKTPPVGYLWNLGESKNTLRKLADLRDDVEMFELADEVAGALQLADQYTYDNNFIYFQPGNGKVKIKEPKQQVQLASQKLKEVLVLA